MQFCGSVGRAVASNTRGPRFRSFIHCQLYRKDETKEKEDGNDPFLQVHNYLADERLLSLPLVCSHGRFVLIFTWQSIFPRCGLLSSRLPLYPHLTTTFPDMGIIDWLVDSPAIGHSSLLYIIHRTAKVIWIPYRANKFGQNLYSHIMWQDFVAYFDTTVVNLIKHFTIVIYDSRVVIYTRKMFIRLATGVVVKISLK